MKAKTLLVAAVMFFGLTAAAFAQTGATFSVGSTPVTTVTRTGYAERTGDITFTNINPTTTVTALGTITVSYGVPITNTGYAIVGTPALGAPAISNVLHAAGVVVINVPVGYAGNFTLTGVRVAIYGTPITFLAAQISAVNNNLVAGQTNPTVITSIGDGLIVSGTAGAINLLTGAATNASISVQEGYLNAFGITPALTNDQTNGNIIRFTLSALPPAGYTISFPGTVNAVAPSTAIFTTATVVENTDGTTATVASSGAAVVITSASTSLKIFYQLTSDSDPQQLETLTIPVTLSYTGSLPVPTASITWTATLAPIGIGLTSSGGIPSPVFIPRYADFEVGPGTLITPPTGAGQTDILIPYGARVGSSGYDTGIAVSNTTRDPGGTILGTTGAVQQTGAITFYFYNSGSKTTPPSNFSYTTSASSPGTGLNALGQLPPGATYSVLLHELIVASQGIDLDFSGYVFVVTAFGNGHVQYVLTDFKFFSNGGQGLVVDGPRNALEALKH